MYLIIGNFRTNYIVKRRLLASSNPAGSSRMLRLAESIYSTGENVSILSSGSSMLLGYNRKLYDPSFELSLNNVKVFVASAFTVPYLSAFWEIFSLTYLFFKLKRKNDLKAIILYCYYPSTTAVCFLAKILGIAIIEDLEDVVNPDVKIGQSTLIDYLRQKIGYLLMQLTLKLADTVIIPNSKFSQYVPISKPILCISGCFNFGDCVLPNIRYSEESKLKILFSGLLIEEQGFDLFLKSLEFLNSKSNSYSKYKFIICGYGFEEIPLLLKIGQFENLDIEFYGFVDQLKYEELLVSCNVCLALQNPHGIFGKLKIPSKAFEYMFYGKMLIVSDVGDFSSFPDRTVLLLEKYSAQSLAEILENLNFQMAVTYGQNAYSYAKDNWSFDGVGTQIINSVNNIRK